MGTRTSKLYQGNIVSSANHFNYLSTTYLLVKYSNCGTKQ